jgi:uncharacterized protein YbjQ (UPF0145 family)
MKTVSMITIGVSLAAIIASAPLAARANGAQDGAATPFTVASAGSGEARPAVKTVLGTMSDHLCRRPWDKAATESEALAALKAKARAIKANGLVDVTFDRTRIGVEASCWQRLTVTGTAVVADELAGR